MPGPFSNLNIFFSVWSRFPACLEYISKICFFLSIKWNRTKFWFGHNLWTGGSYYPKVKGSELLLRIPHYVWCTQTNSQGAKHYQTHMKNCEILILSPPTPRSVKGLVFGDRVYSYRIQYLWIAVCIWSLGALVVIIVQGVSTPLNSSPIFCSEAHQPIPIAF